MDGNSDRLTDTEALQVDPLPGSLSGGTTVLVASAGDPARYAVTLRVLRARGTDADTAFVITTTESADRTIGTYEEIGSGADRPSLGLVDTTSEQQSVSALYGETPIVFTPSPGDLERLVLALSDLSENTSSSNGARHLVVRSLTPILSTAPTARVRTVLERITGLRSETGLGLIGLDYTAHDEETIRALADLVDGVLWVTPPSPNRLAFEYQPTRGRYRPSVMSDTSGDTGD